MPMIPIYRVSADFHNPQYFRFKSEAKLFAMDKPFATIDICYRATKAEVEALIANEKEW